MFISIPKQCSFNYKKICWRKLVKQLQFQFFIWNKVQCPVVLINDWNINIHTECMTLSFLFYCFLVCKWEGYGGFFPFFFPLFSHCIYLFGFYCIRKVFKYLRKDNQARPLKLGRDRGYMLVFWYCLFLMTGLFPVK